MTSVTCNYCNRPARLVHGPDLYPHRPDLSHVKAWRCDPCNAQVGCHDETEKPKGTLAKPELMRARGAAHNAFDPVWQNFRQAYPEGSGVPEPVLRRIARDRAYKWLTHHMGLTHGQAHIGEMDEFECARVVAIVAEQKPTPVSIRTWAKARKAAA
jgi:hypothetical protein